MRTVSGRLKLNMNSDQQKSKEKAKRLTISKQESRADLGVVGVLRGWRPLRLLTVSPSLPGQTSLICDAAILGMSQCT